MKVTIRAHETGNRWTIDYSLPTGERGKYKRKRRTFTTYAAAEQERERVARQFKQFGSHGINIDPVKWRRYVTLESMLHGIGTIEQAVDWFLRNPPRAEGPLISESVESFLDAKDQNVSRAFHKHLARYALRFACEFPETRTKDVTTDQLKNFIIQQGALETQSNVRRVLHSFFGWCVAHGQCDSNPVKLIPAPRVIRPEPLKLPVDQVERLFQEVSKHEGGRMIPFIALRFFGGIRTSSVYRMDWSDIRGEGVLLPASKSKSKRRAFIEGFPPNLMEWLAPHRRESGRVVLTHYGAEVSEIAKRNGIPMSKNVARHSFATYHIAAFRNAPLTALLMAHKGSPRVIWDHYRGNATNQEGESFFAIRPS